MQKTDRIGMRVQPETKQEWESAAKEWGYPNLSAFISGMMNWALAYEKYDGDYETYVKENGLV